MFLIKFRISPRSGLLLHFGRGQKERAFNGHVSFELQNSKMLIKFIADIWNFFKPLLLPHSEAYTCVNYK